jgi:hypothetical protein
MYAAFFHRMSVMAMLREQRTARLKSALIEGFETLHFAFADGSVGANLVQLLLRFANDLRN